MGPSRMLYFPIPQSCADTCRKSSVRTHGHLSADLYFCAVVAIRIHNRCGASLLEPYDITRSTVQVLVWSSRGGGGMWWSNSRCADLTCLPGRYTGVDYVVVDMTNLPQYDQTADAIQLRPFEVMCEVISRSLTPG